MSHIADQILHLRGWAALAVIFVVPALESSIFLGFVFPGEIAVLLGGVLAYQHKVSLPAAIAAGIAGAIIGDSVGYEVGKRWGRGLLHGTIGRIVKHEHLDRAERYLAERGGKAVFFGRFTAALRVLIPGMAGMSGMRYLTFLAYNVAGGALWAGGFVLAGFAAGDGYRRVEHIAKQASLVLLLVAVIVGAAVYGAKKATKHRDRIEAFGRRQLGRRWVASVRGRMAFLTDRLRPGRAIGLAATMSLLALALSGSAFGWVVTRVLSSNHGGLLGVDQPVLDFFVLHRTAGLTDSVHVATFFGSAAFVIPAAIVVGVAARWRLGTWRPLVILGSAYGGAAALQGVIKALVARPRPPAALAVAHFGGWSFPSGHATQAAAFWGALAMVVGIATPSWRRRVVAWTVALVVTVLVGLTRCYLGAHWASDVLGGWSLGVAWLLTIAAISQIAAPKRPEGEQPDAATAATAMTAANAADPAG